MQNGNTDEVAAKVEEFLISEAMAAGVVKKVL
jgi:hypothetical protein